MILFLDTSGFDKLHFALLDPISGKVKEKKIALKHTQSEKTAGKLEAFLKQNSKSFDKSDWRKQLTQILVVSGPGSFTGIRTGIALSMAIGLALDVNVYALKGAAVPAKIKDLLKIKKSSLKKVTQNFSPEYGVEPNITLSKK